MERYLHVLSVVIGDLGKISDNLENLEELLELTSQ